MKKLLFILLLSPFFAVAQQANNLKDTLTLDVLPVDTSGSIIYTVVEKLPVSKFDLHQRAKIWAALAFNSARNVTEYDDPDGTNMVIKAASQQVYTYRFLGTPYPIQYIMYFSMHFTFAENKYRVTIQDLSFETLVTPDVKWVKEPFEGVYKHLREWNGNIKVGNEEFNRELDWSKREARIYGQVINNASDFAQATIADIKKQMRLSAKGDDF